MTKPAKSPDIHTFQADGYIKRCEEEGKEPSEDYLNLYKSAREQDEENMVNPEWQKDNMEKIGNTPKKKKGKNGNKIIKSG